MKWPAKLLWIAVLLLFIPIATHCGWRSSPFPEERASHDEQRAEFIKEKTPSLLKRLPQDKEDIKELGLRLGKSSEDELTAAERDTWTTGRYSGGLSGSGFISIKFPEWTERTTPSRPMLGGMGIFYASCFLWAWLVMFYKMTRDCVNKFEQLYALPTLLGYAILPWLAVKEYDPREVAVQVRAGWVKKLMDRFEQEEKTGLFTFLDRHQGCTLSELRQGFQPFALAYQAVTARRTQRLATALTVVMLLLKPASPVQAQEPKLPKLEQNEGKGGITPIKSATVLNDSPEAPPDTPTETKPEEVEPVHIEQVPEHAAIKTKILGEQVTLSLSKTFAQASTRTKWRYYSRPEGQGTPRVKHRETNTGIDQAQLRITGTAGDDSSLIRWTGYSQVNLFPDGAKLKELWLQASTKVLDKKVEIRFGEMFVPNLSSVPPPFAGTLDGPLTNNLVPSFFGDGLRLSVEALPGLQLIGVAFKAPRDSKAPFRYNLSAAYQLTERISTTVATEFGADPDEEWMLAAELYGQATDSLSFELLGIGQRQADRTFSYGTHLYVRYQLTREWAGHGQFDWVNTESRHGIERHYRATLGVTYSPTSLVTFQIDGAHDWLRSKQHQNAWRLTAGVTIKLP